MTIASTFKSVKIGEEFYAGGHKYVKMSTRTAELISKEEGGRYYFKREKFVTIG
jgi:hypothetical protein